MEFFGRTNSCSKTRVLNEKFVNSYVYKNSFKCDVKKYFTPFYLTTSSSFSAEDNGSPHLIDIVYYLQDYPGGWEHGEFREKMDVQDCNSPPPYQKILSKTDAGMYKGAFWTFPQVRSKEMECVSVQGTTRIMAAHLEKMAEKYKSFMLDRYLLTDKIGFFLN